MALKLGKLDAICARLKKTSAVDVKATTQNGVHAAEVTAGAEGHAKDDAKNATTNNNEETVTDLNETPSTEATTSAVANTSQEAEDDEASLLHETLSIPVSTPALTSTPTQQTGGSSGRRKRRKAAKPRIVSQIQEPFDSDFYEGERGEGEGENSVEGFGFGEQDSPYLQLKARGEEGEDSVEEGHFYREKKDAVPQGFAAGQYSEIQPESPSGSGQFRESSAELNRGLSGVPLDLSTSKTSDDSSETVPSAESGATRHVRNNTADSSQHTPDSSQHTPVVVSPLTAAHAAAVSHNAEAKVLADYAKNTMNELLSIYGFGGAGLEGVDKTLAQRHFENLASLKAVPVDASPKLVARPLERIASKLLNGGQAVHKDVATSANNLSLEGKKSAEIDRSM
ncbi:hypothetical protein BaRGS_00032653 [Batillaria attramentaria]|uniref:Uncharacterized protein n=1 Tax=Batillaria attramentaria TaxID=370345 RepID=A0ABD0JMM6_9CAEN